MKTKDEFFMFFMFGFSHLILIYIYIYNYLCIIRTHSFEHFRKRKRVVLRLEIGNMKCALFFCVSYACKSLICGLHRHVQGCSG